MASGIVKLYFQSVSIKSDHDHAVTSPDGLLLYSWLWCFALSAMWMSAADKIYLLSFSQVLLLVPSACFPVVFAELFFISILARYFPFFCFTNVISAAVFDNGSNWTQFLFCFLFLILLGLNKLNPGPSMPNCISPIIRLFIWPLPIVCSLLTKTASVFPWKWSIWWYV